jgi:hypothetical protein
MHLGVPFKHPYKNVVGFLLNHCAPGDYIALSNRDILYPIRYYCAYVYKNSILGDGSVQRHHLIVDPGILDKSNFDVRIFEEAVAVRPELLVNDAWVERNRSRGIHRYWLLSSCWNRGAIIQKHDNAYQVRLFMSRNFQRIETWNIDDIKIDLFLD